MTQIIRVTQPSIKPAMHETFWVEKFHDQWIIQIFTNTFVNTHSTLIVAMYAYE